MSRWHDKSCLQPQVEVENGTPKCLACHQRPHLSELAAAGAATNSSPPIPPDRPLGELDLWWPPCVPYEKPTKPVEEATSNTHDAEPHSGPTAPKTEVEMPPIGSSSVVYEQAIRSDQLRLIYLAGVEDYDYPVHVALEVYDLENCPEYEAVSYTWGGENGDSTRSCPVYIGPFWDVLFQTKNCWEMLRFMRPRRDARIFWVDAICIDQSNVPERNSQVANMSWIYSQCSRVVLYLGPDMAVPLGGRNPRRHRLHELETGSVVPKFPETHKPPHPITLRTILGRQYFTRAWIIQELVLPSRLSIRVGDVDFWADGNTANYLSSGVTDWAWAQTEAPWGQLLAQGPLVSNELLDLLAMSTKSQATDIRDRVFALFGILPRQGPSPHERSLKADYSMSAQEVFLGTFAYVLTTSPGSPKFLFRASGLGAPPGYPSWAPDWSSLSSDLWIGLMTDYDSRMYGDVMEGLERYREYPRSPTSESMDLLFLNDFRFVIVGDDDEDDDNDDDDEDDIDYDDHHLYNHEFCDVPYVFQRPWYSPSGTRICSATGALKLKLILFLVINIVPCRLYEMGDHSWFSCRIDGNGVVYMFSKHSLDTIVVPGLDRLFILNSDGYRPIYLILRPVSGRQDSYRLVAACLRSCFELEFRKLMPIHDNIRDFGWTQFTANSSNLSAHLSSMQAYLNQLTSDVPPQTRRFFPHATNPRDFLQLAVAHFLAKKPSTSSGALSAEQFQDVYLSYINLGQGGFDARLDDGFIILTFDLEDDAWQSCQQEILDLYNPSEEFSEDGPLWWTVLSTVENGDRWLEARCWVSCLGDMLQEMSESSEYEFEQRLLYLYAASVESGEELLSLWSREPKPEDKDIPCDTWHEFMNFECHEVLQNVGFMGGGLRTVEII